MAVELVVATFHTVVVAGMVDLDKSHTIGLVCIVAVVVAVVVGSSNLHVRMFQL